MRSSKSKKRTSSESSAVNFSVGLPTEMAKQRRQHTSQAESLDSMPTSSTSGVLKSSTKSSKESPASSAKDVPTSPEAPTSTPQEKPHQIGTKANGQSTAGRFSVSGAIQRSDLAPNLVEHSVHIVQPDSRKDVLLLKKVVVNEILAYISCYRNNSNSAALQKVVIGYFSAESISCGKKWLVHEFQSAGGITPFTTERRDSIVRSAQEAEVEDIIGIFDVLDQKQSLDEYLFAAANLNQMPKYGPEETNIVAVVDRQVRMEADVQQLSESVQQLASSGVKGDETVAVNTRASIEDMQHKLEEFCSTVSARMEHLSAVCGRAVENTTPRTVSVPVNPVSQRTQPAHPAPRAALDRSFNIIMFGVAEDRDASAWRKKVDEALRFVTGSAVSTVDMFRIGKFTADKVRPIVVKLQSIWDKRTILGNSKKLREFGQPIFVSADESLEVRRKRIMERIKARAEREGKSVSVLGDVLSIDGINVFSLKNGKLSHNV